MTDKGGIIAGFVMLALFIGLVVYYTPVLERTPYKHPCDFMLNQTLESKETFYSYSNYTCTHDKINNTFSCLFGGAEVCNATTNGV